MRHVKNSWWLLLSVFVVAIDQWTKFLATTHLFFEQPKIIVPGILNWMLDYNRGAAFSFLAHDSGWQRWFFAFISILVCLVLLNWLLSLGPHKKWLAFAMTLIMGGAIGNLIDRLQLGYVIDFIQVYYQHYYWPTFNVADSAVVVGAIMLGISFLFHKEPSI